MWQLGVGVDLGFALGDIKTPHDWGFLGDHTIMKGYVLWGSI
jgi:hypothetical protein